MNRQGQATIEALVCASVLVFGMIFIVHAAFKLTGMILLDDWTDEHLFCQNAECEKEFAARLQALGITEFQNARPAEGSLTFTAESKLFGEIKISKEIYK